MATIGELRERAREARGAAEDAEESLARAVRTAEVREHVDALEVPRGAEYRLLTDAEAKAAILGGPMAHATSNGPGFVIEGGTLMPAPAGALAEVAADAAHAMAEMDRNYAANMTGVTL